MAASTRIVKVRVSVIKKDVVLIVLCGVMQAIYFVCGCVLMIFLGDQQTRERTRYVLICIDNVKQGSNIISSS